MKKSNLLKVGLLGLAFVVTGCGSNENTGGDTFDTSKKISLYSRAAGSGTRECFFETIGYKDVAKDDKWENGVVVSTKSANADLMKAVGDDEYAIGYCSLDSLSSVSTIKAVKYEGVEATKANVLNGSYKLKRNFNFVTRSYEDEADKSKKEAVDGFIAFLTKTTEGQAVIANNGGIVEARTDLVAFSTILENYPIFNSAESLTIDFCGSTSVETIIKAAVEKLETLIPNKKLTYRLNQTGSGDAVAGVTEGKNGKKFGIGFLSREIKSDELAKLTETNVKGAFAIDAVVPIVNAKNTEFTETTAAQLVSIYKGEKSLWSDVITK